MRTGAKALTGGGGNVNAAAKLSTGKSERWRGTMARTERRSPPIASGRAPLPRGRAATGNQDRGIGPSSHEKA